MYTALALLAIALITFIYYRYAFVTNSVDTIFLNISTFIFATFTGFFLSGQVTRFNKLRSNLSAYDGGIQNVYRETLHIDEEAGKKVGQLIFDDYSKLLTIKKWNLGLLKEDTALIRALSKVIREHTTNYIKNANDIYTDKSLNSILRTLAQLRILRKESILLNEENLTLFQWVFLMLLALSFIIVISTIPSLGNIVAALVKAMSVIAVVMILIILKRIENLTIAEKIIGIHSAQDVLNSLKQDGLK